MNDPLQQLTDADLEALSTALRSGRLTPPFSEVAVRRHCSVVAAVEVTGRLQDLAHQEMRPSHLSVLLDSIAEVRRQRRSEEELIDLVWTGPECSATYNRDTSVVVRDLFGQAEESVLVSAYALYNGLEVFDRLGQRLVERPHLKVQLFLDVHRRQGDCSPNGDVVRRFAVDFVEKHWPVCDQRPVVYYDPRSLEADPAKRASLHAKCIVVDRRVALITSANLTEAAQQRNIEVGVLVNSPAFAGRLVGHFDSLVAKQLVRRVAF